MTALEQNIIKEKAYKEAMRYIDNAKKTLTKGKKLNNNYQDIKYVRTACGTAYVGALLALDTYLMLKGIRKDKDRVHISFYQSNISKLDKTLLNILNNVYEILHVSGYYGNLHDAIIINQGIKNAEIIIDKIKPHYKN